MCFIFINKCAFVLRLKWSLLGLCGFLVGGAKYTYNMLISKHIKFC